MEIRSELVERGQVVKPEGTQVERSIQGNERREEDWGIHLLHLEGALTVTGRPK